MQQISGNIITNMTKDIENTSKIIIIIGIMNLHRINSKKPNLHTAQIPMALYLGGGGINKTLYEKLIAGKLEWQTGTSTIIIGCLHILYCHLCYVRMPQY